MESYTTTLSATHGPGAEAIVPPANSNIFDSFHGLSSLGHECNVHKRPSWWSLEQWSMCCGRRFRQVVCCIPNKIIFDDSGRQLMMTSKHPGKIMTQTQFLKKLPKTIIKNGKVIDIRDSVGRTLAGSDGSTADACKPNVTLINTSVTKEMSESVASSGSATERPGSYKGHGDVTTLRVVTGNGDHTYIVKMKFKETVGDLRIYLDAHRRPAVPYDIVSTFPHKIHNNNILTLEESGLTPNAVLHLKPHK